ncbi:hypothetical protein NQZ68_031414 [Dissostichus eleginoides]|nr:hypothetical protein NQZ68_031414 [Dissostichus eleginoides]
MKEKCVGRMFGEEFENIIYQDVHQNSEQHLTTTPHRLEDLSVVDGQLVCAKGLYTPARLWESEAGTLRRVTFSVVSQPQDGGCYDSGLEDSETPSSKSSSGPRLGALPLPEEGYERTTPEGSVGEEEHVENDARQLPDVALTGKCTRECDEFGHSDTCWMPVRTSPRQRQRHGSDPPRLSTFAPGDDNNNLRGNDHESDSESAGSAGSSEPGVVVSGEGQRFPLVNGDPLGTLGSADRNRNMGDHNRNLLNRKMTSASYDTFSSAGFGRRQQDEEGGEGQNPAEVIPLTRTGGDYKTTSCLTLSRRETPSHSSSSQLPHDCRHTLLHGAEEWVWIKASTS